MYLKIIKAYEGVGAKNSMDSPHANIKSFYYRGLPYTLNDLSKEQLLFLVNELNTENMGLEKRITDLETSIYNIEEKLREHNDYFNELEVI